MVLFTTATKIIKYLGTILTRNEQKLKIENFKKKFRVLFEGHKRKLDQKEGDASF